MTEAKPILLIYIPDDTPGSQHGIREALSEKFNDYHVLCLPKSHHTMETPVELSVFYPKDFTQIQYDELKTLITNSIEQMKSNPQP